MVMSAYINLEAVFGEKKRKYGKVYAIAPEELGGRMYVVLTTSVGLVYMPMDMFRNTNTDLNGSNIKNLEPLGVTARGFTFKSFQSMYNVIFIYLY